ERSERPEWRPSVHGCHGYVETAYYQGLSVSRHYHQRRRCPNVVPEEVCLDYYYRAATLEGLWKLNKISEDCARGAALATGTTVEWVQRYPDYGELYWNEYMQEMMEGFFANVGRTVKPSPGPGGSSDIGNVNMKVPVFHPLIDITGNDP